MYARGIWYYRWTAIGVAWAISVAGWTAVYLLPNVYEANAQFYVDASSRLREVVKQLGMEPDVASRVFLVRQAMLGRPQLERVARETDLDLSVNTPEDEEALYTRLRETISLTTGRGREAQNLFDLSYQHQDRQVAFEVVNEMLNSFVEDVLKLKDSDTARTQEFLKEQLTYYRGLLEKTEAELQIFKREHPSFVVGSRGDYFSRMQQSNEDLEELRNERAVEVNKRNELRRQLANVNPYGQPDPSDRTTTGIVSSNHTSVRLNELEKTRSDLLLRVTESHPRVVALTEQIDSLRKQFEKELAEAAASAATDGASAATNPVYVEMQITLSNSNLKIAELDTEMNQLRAKIKKLQNEVDRAPKLESEFVRLSRDYDNYQVLYNEVLESSERERIGRVGEEQDVISFNIINPPRASVKPAAPNRPLLLAAVLVLAVGAGGGLALLLWFIKPTIHSEGQLADITRTAVIGSIGINYRTLGKSKGRSLILFGLSASVLVIACIAVIAVEETASLILRDAAQNLIARSS